MSRSPVQLRAVQEVALLAEEVVSRFPSANSTIPSPMMRSPGLVLDLHKEVHLAAVAVAEADPASPSSQVRPGIPRTREPEPRQALGSSATDRTRKRLAKATAYAVHRSAAPPRLKLRGAARGFQIRKSEGLHHRPLPLPPYAVSEDGCNKPPPGLKGSPVFASSPALLPKTH